MKLCTEGMFLYKGKLYKHADGAAMGSPLGPTLANWYMGTIEKKCLQIICHLTLNFMSDMWMMYLLYLVVNRVEINSLIYSTSNITTCDLQWK